MKPRDKLILPRLARSAAALVVLLCLDQQPVRGAEIHVPPTTNKQPPTDTELKGVEATWRLYLEGKLDEAYESWERKAKDNPQDAHAWEAMMGRIQERWGNLDKALALFQRSLEGLRAKGRWSETNTQGLKNYTRHEMGTLANLATFYEWQGKMGLATKTRFEIRKIMEEAVDEIAAAETLNCVDCVEVFGGFAMWRDAKPFSHRGACPEACEIYRKTGAEAEAKKRYQLAREAWSDWATHLAFFEHYPEAIELREKLEPLPFDRRYVHRAELCTIEFAENLSQRDGVTSNVWHLVEAALARLETPPHQNNWFTGSIIKAQLLDKEGRSGEALQLLDSIIELARAKNYQPHIAAGLENRARINLALGKLNDVEADVKESLQVYRTLGKKEIEPNLYEIYARLLGKQGHYDEAVRTWELSYSLCENLKLHFRSLHMLLGLAELQLQQERFDELEASWKRIGSFVANNIGDLPEPTLLRFHLARLEFLRSKGARAELSAANNEARAFVNASQLSPYQLRDSQRWEKSLPAILASLRPREATPPPKQLQPQLDLQPVLVRTMVRTNEIARGHFTLTNPSGEPAQETLLAASKGFRAEWSPGQEGLLLKLVPDESASASSQQIHVPPGQQILLTVECDPAAQLTNHVLTLRRGGENGQTARWDFSFGEDARALAVINASLVEDNPFYSISLFHEVYFRGETEAVANLRVQAGEPCRVEVVDAFSHQILAIDANGDGDFEDVGDAITADTDLNGYADFKVSSAEDVKRFELLVFPHFKQSRTEREIEITLFFGQPGGWTPQAINKLIIK